jgi:hypothetical protein
VDRIKNTSYDPGGYRILVINTPGEVWAHDLGCTTISGQFGCLPPTTVDVGYKLAGPGLFGGSNDKYALVAAEAKAGA